MLWKVAQSIYSVVAVLCVAVTVVIWFFLLWVIVLVGLRNTRFEAFCIRLWNRLVFRAFLARLELEGLENYDPRKPCIIISNHQSLLDIPTVYEVFSGPVKMLAKKELFQIPVFGWAMKAAGLVPVDRGNREASQRTLELMRQRVEEGVQIWLAPEGTRSQDGSLGPFKGGAFRMASDLNLPIVSLVMSGTREVLPKGSFRIRPFKTVKARVLPAKKMQDVGAKDYREFRDYFAQEFEKNLEELQRLSGRICV